MDQANAAKRQQLQLSGQVDAPDPNSYGLIDQEDQEFSSEDEDSYGSESDEPSDRYQTPIQPSQGRMNDSEKHKQLLSTHPETVQKPDMRKRDQKAQDKENSPVAITPFSGKESKRKSL